MAGRSRLDQDTEADDLNTVSDGRNRATLVNAGWRFTPSPSFILTQRVAAAAQKFTNVNGAGVELGRGTGRDLTWRADFTATGPKSLTFEGGAQIQWQHRDTVERQLLPLGVPLVVKAYDDDAQLASAIRDSRLVSGHARGAVAQGPDSIDGR